MAMPITKTSTGGVLLRDGAGDIVIEQGTTVPTDTTTGYAKGAHFLKSNVATGTGGVYFNKGTNTSCVFSLVTQA